VVSDAEFGETFGGESGVEGGVVDVAGQRGRGRVVDDLACFVEGGAAFPGVAEFGVGFGAMSQE
jgi:hypothetical protein